MATAASLKKAAKTRAAKKALMGKTLPQLKKMAKAKNLHGYSTLNKGALVTMLVKGKSPKKVTKTALRKEMAEAKTQAWHGKGPYRVVLAKTGKVYGDLGPYATARASLADAKTLLRRMAPADRYTLSNVEGQKSAGKKFAQGVIVDGYVAQGSPDIGAGAFVIRVGDTAATRKDVFPKGLRSNRRNRRKNGTYYSVRLPAGYRTKWHSPRRALTRGAFATKAKAHAWAKQNVPGEPYDIVSYSDGRSNPRVSFQTKDGPVSFQAKKKRNARTNAKKSIKGLKISGHRWRDSYGNTYHRAYITVNGRHVGTTPISYGYGHHYLQTAKEWLKGHGYRKPSGRMSTYDAGYDDVKRKKDL